jgi:hypothetical protein
MFNLREKKMKVKDVTFTNMPILFLTQKKAWMGTASLIGAIVFALMFAAVYIALKFVLIESERINTGFSNHAEQSRVYSILDLRLEENKKLERIGTLIIKDNVSYETTQKIYAYFDSEKICLRVYESRASRKLLKEYPLPPNKCQQGYKLLDINKDDVVLVRNIQTNIDTSSDGWVMN